MLGRPLIKRALLLRTLKNAAENAKQIRHGHGGAWAYRVPPQMPSKKEVMLAQGLGGLCWWWILYHIATEPEHIYGEWPYIDPSTYTDEELGIPDETAGPLKKA